MEQVHRSPSAALRLLLDSGGDATDYSHSLFRAVVKEAPSVDPKLAAKVAIERAGELIKDLNVQQAKIIKKLTARAIIEGWADNELAARISEKIGLDDKAAQAAENFRTGLVKNGMGKGLARQRTREYIVRLRAHRANVIAKTELARAISDAKRETWDAWKAAGLIDQYTVRIWHTAKSERTCKICRPMNGVRAAVGRDYKNGMTGPPAHPSCECWETLDRGNITLHKSAADHDRVWNLALQKHLLFA